MSPIIVEDQLADCISVRHDRFGFITSLALGGVNYSQPFIEIELNPLLEDHVQLLTHLNDPSSGQFYKPVQYKTLFTGDRSNYRHLCPNSVHPCVRLDPRCPRCGKEIKVQHGRLRCDNTHCSAVLAERLAWFFSVFPIIEFQWDQDIFYTAIVVDDILDIPALFDRNNYTVLSSIDGISRSTWQENVEAIDLADKNTLFKIVYGLSIPGVTYNDIVNIIESCYSFTECELNLDNIISVLSNVPPQEYMLREKTLNELRKISSYLTR